MRRGHSYSGLQRSSPSYSQLSRAELASSSSLDPAKVPLLLRLPSSLSLPPSPFDVDVRLFSQDCSRLNFSDELCVVVAAFSVGVVVGVVCAVCTYGSVYALTAVWCSYTHARYIRIPRLPGCSLTRYVYYTAALSPSSSSSRLPSFALFDTAACMCVHCHAE